MSSYVRKLPPIVALAGWLLPGGGYLLLGQRTRGLVIGITIVLVFMGGLLIGGVRLLEVPMYDENGQAIENGEWVREIRAKPWSIAQILAGPVSIAGGVWSIEASIPDPAGHRASGAKAHVRLLEIGTLYTAVAGMLNLLAIIDATSRATREPA